jgi:tetratricopeptide (TPR) repeat protein
MRLARTLPPFLLPLALLAACSTYQRFDSVGYLRSQYAERVGSERAAGIAVPFELDAPVRAAVASAFKPAPEESRRIDQVLDYVFHRLDLRYALLPTRNAVETFREREGNCLSFVNLFVGIAREVGLDPFYVEVTDLQKWNRREGMVVSQGHIVAGMYVKGKLSTFDFLPYRPKSYRNFKPIDDRIAAAHYYNNLGAEALLAGDLARARELVTVATEIAPDFDKALNNLGVCYARAGQVEEALKTYERALALDPGNELVMTNQARALQQLGRGEEADAVLARVEQSNTTNPFFFIYEGDVALGRGDNRKALDYMARALRQDSEVPEVHLGLVRVYLALGEVDKARHHLERALKLDATNAEARKYAHLLTK